MFTSGIEVGKSMINTHAIVKSLIETGFTEIQAEAITNAVVSGKHNIEEFVTKEQYDVIVQELGLIKKDTADMKTKIAVVEQRLDGIQQQLNDIKHFMAPFLIGIVTMLIALLGLGVSLFFRG